MITWLQSTFGKHHKIIFGSLLAVVILAFVLTIGPQSVFMAQDELTAESRKVFGVDLSSSRDMQRLQKNAQLSAMLNPDDTRIFRNNLMDYGFARAAGLHLAAQFGITSPTEEQSKEFITSRGAFKDENGNFSRDRFTSFRDGIINSGQATMDDVNLVLLEDWRIDQVTKALGGPGFLLPYEALRKYIEDNTRWTVELATMDFNAVQLENEPVDEELIAFYEINPARFEEPERVDLLAVEFLSENYLTAIVEPTEVELRSYFEQNKPRFQKAPPPPAEGEEAPAPAETTFEEAQADVLTAVRNDRSRKLAEQAASSFVTSLYRQKIARGSTEFDALVAQLKGNSNDLAPYNRNNPPWSSGIPYQSLMTAFGLSADNYFSDIVRTAKGAAILIFQDRIPPYVPSFEEARAKVLAQFTQEERRRLFTERGEETSRRIEDALVTGSTFAEIADSMGLEHKSFDSFTGLEVPMELRGTLFESVMQLLPGETTPMIFEQNKGTFALLLNKEVPTATLEDDGVKTQLTEMSEMLQIVDSWSLLAEYAAAEIKRVNPQSNLAVAE